jgi:hypothetical protein
LRRLEEGGQPFPSRIVEELGEVLTADQDNCRSESLEWSEIQQAIELFQQDPRRFLKLYFLEELDRQSKGVFSVTSR